MRPCVAVMMLLVSNASPPQGLMRPSIIGIEPLRTNVAEAGRILGIAPWARESDGSESSPVVMCYSSIARDAFLLVQSGAAGGYGKHDVTGFVLTEREPKLRAVTRSTDRSSRAVSSNLCRESALVSRGLELSNGLRLGMSQAEVVALIGPPTSTRGATLMYRRDDRVSLPDAGSGSPGEGDSQAGDYAVVAVEPKDDHVYAVSVERSNML